jgi:hypothetical protein
MDILELTNSKPDGNGAVEKTGFMNLRKSKPRESLQEKLLSVRDKPRAAENSAAAANSATVQANPAAIDSLVRGLVDLLPKPDGVWPLDDRAKWLRLAAGIFDLGYRLGDGEDRQLRIAIVKPQAPNA